MSQVDQKNFTMKLHPKKDKALIEEWNYWMDFCEKHPDEDSFCDAINKMNKDLDKADKKKKKK